MVCEVCAIYGIVLAFFYHRYPCCYPASALPTLYIVCPYLVSAGMWKSRGDFLLALDHCGVIVFCFHTAI